MFNRNTSTQTEQKPDGKTVVELTVENEGLRIEKETLELKVSGLEDRIKILTERVDELKRLDAAKLRTELEAANKKLADMQFRIDNDISGIQMKTENETLKSELSIKSDEIEHLKKLLDAYRSMPDVKNMVESLSSLAVPSIDQLKEFSKVVSDSKAGELIESLSNTNDMMRRAMDVIAYRVRPV